MRMETNDSYHVRQQIQKTDLESIQLLLMLGNMNQSNYMNLYQTMNKFFELIFNLWAIFEAPLLEGGDIVAKISRNFKNFILNFAISKNHKNNN